MRKLLLTAALIGLAGCATETEEEQLSCNADGLRDILVSEETDAKSKAIANVPGRTISTSEIEAARNALEAEQNARNEYTERFLYVHELRLSRASKDLNDLIARRDLRGRRVQRAQREYEEFIASQYDFKDVVTKESLNEGVTNYIICDGALEKVSGDFTGREQITGDWTWRHEKTIEGESIFTRLRGRNKQAELK